LTSENLPVETGPQPEFAGDFAVRQNPDAIVRLSAMRTIARCAQEAPESVSVVDTRPADAFRGGRIACAVNIPWTENITGGEIQTFRPAAELRQLYEGAGVAEDAPVVTYCRTGMQASVAYFVLRHLGREVHLYDGSYGEWSKSQ
jgi:thiosulfate/3-mercaptopyruvate sulfurtransferase